uniref:F-box domain-containing protein n=1 Tax=Panagrolaimus sp. ES5 TaxID=591445 RepID=A0AC34G3I2_9BILA
MITFNAENMVRQHFAFPAPIMDYIFKNVEPKHLIKLYQTCKFFYNKFHRNIIQNLEIVDDGEAEVLDPTKTIICVSNPFLSKFADFCITDSLIYRAAKNNERLLNFSQCTVKKLELSEKILWEEFVMLTKAGTVEVLKVKGIHGKTPLTFAPVEEIIAQVPNATSIEISESTITEKTSESLLSLNHEADIKNFVLKNIKKPFSIDSDMLIDFFVKNAHLGCNICIEFELWPETNKKRRAF